MVLVTESALCRGFTREDLVQAATDWVVGVDMSDSEGWRELRFGFSLAGELLETMVTRGRTGQLVVFHAMAARPHLVRKYMRKGFR